MVTDGYGAYRPYERGIWVGNREATVLFYLSNVLGGFTAFPDMGVAVKPSAGSAVFWYNLDRQRETFYPLQSFKLNFYPGLTQGSE